MGVTGSGKTFTMANVIQAVGRPTLVMSHNKTLAAQLYSEFKEFFPHNAVHYFVSYYDYYQPEAYIPQTRHLYRKRRLHQPADRPPPPGRHQRPCQPRRCNHRGQRSCIYGLGSPEDYRAMMVGLEVGQTSRSRPGPGQTGRYPIRAERFRISARQIPRPRRLRRNLAHLRGNRLSHGVLGRRSRATLDHQSRKRRSRRTLPADVRLSLQALRHARGTHPAGRREIRKELKDRLEEFQSPRQRCSKPIALTPAPVTISRCCTKSVIARVSKITAARFPGDRRTRRPILSSAFSPMIFCCLLTNRTSPCRKSAECMPAITTAKLLWSNTVSACLAPWITAR